MIYPLGSKAVEELLPNELIGVLPEEVNKLFGMDNRYKEKFIITATCNRAEQEVP